MSPQKLVGYLFGMLSRRRRKGRVAVAFGVEGPTVSCHGVSRVQVEGDGSVM